ASAGDRVSSVPVASANGTTLLQQHFVSVVKVVSPSVVQIQTPQALGSGVVFDNRGDIVTNAHVVGNTTRFVVTLAAGDSHPANAGGALVNLSGQVIGIPTLSALDPEMGAEAPGIGFAIDSNTVRTAAIRLVSSVTGHGATR